MSDFEKEPSPAAGMKGVEIDDVEGQLEDVDPVAESKLVRKLDLFIIPVVMLLYLLSFLDRLVGMTLLYLCCADARAFLSLSLTLSPRNFLNLSTAGGKPFSRILLRTPNHYKS
jgi:hypothetical protein